MPERPAARKIIGDTSLYEQLSGLLEVIRDPLFKRYVPFSVTSQGGMLALQSLWMGPWLRDVVGLSRAETASSLLLMTIALASGFLSWGIIGERLGRYGVSSMTISLLGVAIFLIVQLIIIFKFEFS